MKSSHLAFDSADCADVDVKKVLHLKQMLKDKNYLCDTIERMAVVMSGYIVEGSSFDDFFPKVATRKNCKMDLNTKG